MVCFIFKNWKWKASQIDLHWIIRITRSLCFINISENTIVYVIYVLNAHEKKGMFMISIFNNTFVSFRFLLVWSSSRASCVIAWWLNWNWILLFPKEGMSQRDLWYIMWMLWKVIPLVDLNCRQSYKSVLTVRIFTTSLVTILRPRDTEDLLKTNSNIFVTFVMGILQVYVFFSFITIREYEFIVCVSSFINYILRC